MLDEHSGVHPATTGTCARTSDAHARVALRELLGATQTSLIVASKGSNAIVIWSIRDGELIEQIKAVPSPMGVGVGDGRVALGTEHGIHVFQTQTVSASEARLLPSAFLHTGRVSIHEVLVEERSIDYVDTAHSTVNTIGARLTPEIRWAPPFVVWGELDACHLNGLCKDKEGTSWATCFGLSNKSSGWRELGLDAGLLINCDTGQIVEGLSMPHSPMSHGGRVLVLESAKGCITAVSVVDGSRTTLFHSGYLLRGMTIVGDVALIGASRLRGGSANASELRARLRGCDFVGIIAVDLSNARELWKISLSSVIGEVSSVASLNAAGCSFERR